jgi:voltage-gated potassium channel
MAIKRKLVRQPEAGRQTPYGIFLAVMTLFALINSAVLAFNWIYPFVTDAQILMIDILIWIDTFFIILFLADWVHSVVVAESRMRYLFGARPFRSIPYGTVELIGCLPFSFVFRFLRLARLRRIGWRWYELTPRSLYRAVVSSRAESAVLITAIVSFLVIALGSISILYFEIDQPFSTIDNAEDAFWWAIVTITTVGYGDAVPFTLEGRVVGVITMIVGIGIFGVVAGSLAGALTYGRDKQAASQADAAAIVEEVAQLREEIRELRRALEADG